MSASTPIRTGAPAVCAPTCDAAMTEPAATRPRRDSMGRWLFILGRPPCGRCGPPSSPSERGGGDAAIHHQHLARHEARLVGGEEADGAGDVLRGAEPPERRAGDARRIPLGVAVA